MGLFDLFDTFADIAPKTTTISNPKLLLTRKQEEELKAKHREHQKKVEDTLYGINYDLGRAAENLHTATNKVSDTARRLNDTFNNPQDALNPNNLMRELFEDDHVPNKGDHLKVIRLGYTHHGIYIGDGQVIHYLLKNVQKDSLETFANGSKIRVVSENESPARFSPSKIVERAHSRLYENEYNLIWNNCEHFARWCRCGDALY